MPFKWRNECANLQSVAIWSCTKLKYDMLRCSTATGATGLVFLPNFSIDIYSHSITRRTEVHTELHWAGLSQQSAAAFYFCAMKDNANGIFPTQQTERNPKRWCVPLSYRDKLKRHAKAEQKKCTHIWLSFLGRDRNKTHVSSVTQVKADMSQGH